MNFKKGIRYLSTKAHFWYCEIGSGSYLASSVSIDRLSTVGNYTYIAKRVIVTNAEIGSYVSIAPDVKIGLGEHNLNSFSTSLALNANAHNLTKGYCRIENDVWIGTGVVIRRGVTVKTGSVVGANSVVTKDVEAYTVVGGVPARLIKKRFSDKTIKELIDSDWWDSDPDVAIKALERITLAHKDS